MFLTILFELHRQFHINLAVHFSIVILMYTDSFIDGNNIQCVVAGNFYKRLIDFLHET